MKWSNLIFISNNNVVDFAVEQITNISMDKLLNQNTFNIYLEFLNFLKFNMKIIKIY